MMKKFARKFVTITSVLAIFNGALLGATLAQNNPPPVQVDPSLVIQQPDKPVQVIYRVYVNGQADVNALANGGWDLVEGRGPDYLLLVGDDDVANRLRAQGFRVERDAADSSSPRFTALPDGLVGINTYYGGYRTVTEQYAHLDSVATAHPDKVSLVTYGTSLQGRPLRAICITKLQAGDCALNVYTGKPRFLMMAAIHARELTTSEMAYRWIDYLVDNYNVDADVTMLLDTSEMWVIPVVNPDGRVIVESGGNTPYLQRKNARDTGACANPPTSSNQDGVDLNRNASTDNYGGAGTSTDPCAQTYRGTGPASEPEQSALESFFQQLFADTKGPNRNDPAATNTRGVFITVHTYSNLVLLPYGDALAAGQAPNVNELRHLAFRMSNYNNYQTGTGDEILYSTTGTTDDWMYGKLGVPSFTFEIGPSSGTCSGFTPSYSCQDSTFWPLNRPAFMYAAKVVRDPYISPSGPTSSNLAVAAVPQGCPATLNGNANDNAYGNASGSVGRPAVQNVSAAEYYIDTPPWNGGTPIAMSASDGSFNSNNENVTASVATGSLSVGRHTLYVRGRDANNNWGSVSAVFLTVNAASTCGGGSPVTLNPTADAYVRSGTYASSNFGTSTSLQVRTSSASSGPRWTYLRFDTSSFSGSLSDAKLRVYGSNSSSNNLTIEAFGVSNTTWGETTITWNNKPALNASAITSLVVNGTSGAYREWNVTSYIQSERAAGRNVVTLALKVPSNVSITFTGSSKESSTNKPQLVITP
jgi:murein tripeptide amidase MpaA